MSSLALPGWPEFVWAGPVFYCTPAVGAPVAGPPCLLFLNLVATSKRYWPKCSARTTAASFPLGNISPWSKSHTDNTSPVLSLAEVPPTVAAFLEACSMVCYAFSLILRTICITTKAVIILVSDAISLRSFSHLPNRISPVLPSQMDQLLAVTNGGAKSTSKIGRAHV